MLMEREGGTGDRGLPFDGRGHVLVGCDGWFVCQPYNVEQRKSQPHWALTSQAQAKRKEGWKQREREEDGNWERMRDRRGTARTRNFGVNPFHIFLSHSGSFHSPSQTQFDIQPLWKHIQSDIFCRESAWWIVRPKRIFGEERLELGEAMLTVKEEGDGTLRAEEEAKDDR
jgi:hypothetical protein